MELLSGNENAEEKLDSMLNKLFLLFSNGEFFTALLMGY